MFDFRRSSYREDKGLAKLVTAIRSTRSTGASAAIGPSWQLLEAENVRRLFSLSSPAGLRAIGNEDPAFGRTRGRGPADFGRHVACGQCAISSMIGHDQSAYHAASGAKGISFANTPNGFTAFLQAGRLQVSSGSDTWDLSPVKLVDGGSTTPLSTAQASVSGNRVDLPSGRWMSGLLMALLGWSKALTRRRCHPPRPVAS